MSLNRNSWVLVMGVIISASLLSSPMSATAKQEYRMKVAITVNDKIFTATLNDSQASRDFAALLPLTLQMKDYAGEEKISDLPSRVSTVDSPAGTSAKKGDLTIYAPWGNLAIFYKAHSYASGLIRLGQLDDPEALPVTPLSYTAKFELLK